MDLFEGMWFHVFALSEGYYQIALALYGPQSPIAMVA